MTAKEAYAEQKAESMANLVTLRKLIIQNGQNQSKNPTHWGFVGDLVEINSKLSDAIEFLK